MTALLARWVSRRAGFSLAEVIVASAVFALLGLIGFYLTQFGTLSSRRSDSENDAFRQGTQAISRIRRELRGAEVLQPSSGKQAALLFRYPAMNGESLEVDGAGHPLWDGVARISADQGALWIEKPLDSSPRQLARLGGRGSFSAEVDRQFVVISVAVDLGKPGEQFHQDFRLAR